MSQIIDLGNSGIQFAESGVINLGSRGSGIQFWMPDGSSSATYWTTAMTASWDTAMTALWDTAMSEEV